ncbi:glycosyltransferase [Microvirga subterranea]|uniref:Glycosyltransferase involved in cell wall biosynthesis n=1 Tax=Microvirga subterranea TaxID=186651 RepID=A0A370HIY0_9HYPH|nr:glycosyltransferase [Microvirga subterranea]RDI58543.1 glycosyltransferase involved in cell wall biosynthesis [Microvirga subterranea]
MKLLVFTPALKASAIGRMTSLVTRELVSSGHEVAVVRTEAQQYLTSATHNFNAELVPWTDGPSIVDLARHADALVYQVGDNYDFHRGVVEWLPHYPGLVCLHDFFLGHLFYGWAQSHRMQAEATLRAWYGNDVASRFFGYSTSDAFIEGTREASPMTEWIGSMAYGVITHSNWGIERVVNSCPGPVEVVPLAYNIIAPLGSESIETRSTAVAPRFELLTIGHVNSNKRARSVIQAIGNSGTLREKMSYRLIGHIQPETKADLLALAERCQVNVVISGEVRDEILAKAIRDADVVSCLRWPTLEAASASAIEAMLFGKPIIVTNAGFYSEIPDTCVVKIDPHDEVNSIQSALELLLSDQQRRQLLAQAARSWASQTFCPQNYAARLLDMACSTSKARPALAAIDQLMRISQRWGGSAEILALEDTVRPLAILSSLDQSEPSSLDVII